MFKSITSALISAYNYAVTKVRTAVEVVTSTVSAIVVGRRKAILAAAVAALAVFAAVTLVTVGVPTMVAAAILGGAAAYLLRDVKAVFDGLTADEAIEMASRLLAAAVVGLFFAAAVGGAPLGYLLVGFLVAGLVWRHIGSESYRFKLLNSRPVTV